MITILILIYIVSVIMSYFEMRRELIRDEDNPQLIHIIIICIPILNIFVLLAVLFSFIWKKLNLYIDFSSIDFYNWFFKIPKR